MCSVPVEWEASFQSGWYHGLYAMILARPEYTFGVGFLIVQQRYTKSVALVRTFGRHLGLYVQ